MALWIVQRKRITIAYYSFKINFGSKILRLKKMFQFLFPHQFLHIVLLASESDLQLELSTVQSYCQTFQLKFSVIYLEIFIFEHKVSGKKNRNCVQ